MDRCQKGLDMLMEKYEIPGTAKLLCGDVVRIDGSDYPLLPWKNTRRFEELRNIVRSGRLGAVCTYRIGHTAVRGTDLFSLLEREAGILEFTVDSPVREAFAVGSGDVMNCILETENGCVCTIELAATLNEGAVDVDKHEIIARHGIACDRVVDTQVPQNSIYMFCKDCKEFTDTDFELYDYSEGEIARIRNAFAILKDKAARTENLAGKAHLEEVLKAVRQSLELCENCKVKENG